MKDHVIRVIETAAGRRFRRTHRSLRRTFVAWSIAMASLLLVTAGTASATSVCQGRALRTTPAVNPPFMIDPGAVDRSMPRIVSGATVDELALYAVGKSGHGNAYCVQGGPCYPSTAIALLNCTVGAAQPNDATMLPLELIRSKFSFIELVQHDVNLELVAKGLSSAAAYGASDEYARHPASTCAKTVANALEDDAAALRSLEKPTGGPCPG